MSSFLNVVTTTSASVQSQFNADQEKTVKAFTKGANESGELKGHENFGVRLVNVIYFPVNLVKAVAHTVLMIFTGLAAMLLVFQSSLLNKFAAEEAEAIGTSFKKVGLNLIGLFNPTWATKHCFILNMYEAARVHAVMV